ncbi:MAG: hypothetical protein Q4P32_06225 [Micrococcales bacterium]|nr:hypothetical protein [Micrococcales bacterium]
MPNVIRRTSDARRRRTRLAASVAILVVTGSGAVALVTSSPAYAGWQSLDQRVINVALACRDGIRFEAGIVTSQGAPPATSDYPTVFKMASPALGPGKPWDERRVVARQSIVIPKLGAPVTVPRDANPADTIILSHRGRYLVPVQTARRPLPVGSAAVTLGASSPSYATVAVRDCYLYAPVDVVPGRANNQVRIGGVGRAGEVVVALKSASYLRADRLNPRTFRFGPAKAAPLRSRVADINGDRRRDLVMTFKTSATGLTCQSTSAALVGQTRTGERVEGRDKVTPVGCPH